MKTGRVGHSQAERLRGKHERLPDQTGHFYRLLNNIRLDDKAHFAKNLKDLRSATRRLETEFAHLRAHEEKCLFPFLLTRIPRLEPLIWVLLSEHEDFRRLFRDLQIDLKRLAGHKGDRAGALRAVRDDGAYLMCLLRSHLWVEKRKVYLAARQELKPQEKSMLSTCLARQGKR